MSHRWFPLFIGLSLLFAGLFLYRQDYLAIPALISPIALFGSLLAFNLAWALQAAAWRAFLHASGESVGFRPCLLGTGLSVFAKYIPGKVMAVVGRAAYLSRQLNLPLGRLSLLSLGAQLLTLWSALLLGAIPLLFLLEPEPVWLLAWGLAWLGFSALLFTPWLPRGLRWLARRLGRAGDALPWPPAGRLVRALPWFLVFWLVMGAGFYLFLVAMSTESPPIWLGLVYPLAIAIGIATLFAPAGLGVIEAALAGMLVWSGMPLAEAGGMALATRLALFASELVFFVQILLLRARWRA